MTDNYKNPQELSEKEKPTATQRREINLFEQDLFDPPYSDKSSGNPSNSAQLSPNRLNTVLDDLYAHKAEQEKERQARRRVKQIIEALLFCSHEPLSFPKIRSITDPVYPFKPKALYDILNELKQEYMIQQKAFRLEEIAQGFILRTCEEFSPFLDQLYGNKRYEKLSPASIEVLAIIAYKQPISRSQIEAIRGVDSTGIVQNLLERGLIEPVGKLEQPGRPTVYGSTKEFLKHFGLRDLKELPQVAPPSFSRYKETQKNSDTPSNS